MIFFAWFLVGMFIQMSLVGYVVANMKFSLIKKMSLIALNIAISSFITIDLFHYVVALS